MGYVQALAPIADSAEPPPTAEAMLADLLGLSTQAAAGTGERRAYPTLTSRYPRLTLSTALVHWLPICTGQIRWPVRTRSRLLVYPCVALPGAAARSTNTALPAPPEVEEGLLELLLCMLHAMGGCERTLCVCSLGSADWAQDLMGASPHRLPQITCPPRPPFA